jgi:hypothetical protein
MLLLKLFSAAEAVEVAPAEKLLLQLQLKSKIEQL